MMKPQLTSNQLYSGINARTDKRVAQLISFGFKREGGVWTRKLNRWSGKIQQIDMGTVMYAPNQVWIDMALVPNLSRRR